VIKLESKLMYSPDNLAMNGTDRRIIGRAEMKFLSYISRHNVKGQWININTREFLKIHNLHKVIFR
jgi:hypothetical protein